ncbi:hypothetical protein BDP55DRAFT_377000 [Colletotrichum godetiae]|uniref:Uncharacterized protein n=1 Tax=Colletotrichum godetiae TaxID=1209918 RepID=A0AAJ0ASU8_9PEZI|nr:uncharacterized protein BDP55DRAFT_377000 [Colletotrichum godetiae]KAK1689730.1 hypothetical protein BDP55DRAFT_377000 [Colletotrichum godetiae]
MYINTLRLSFLPKSVLTLLFLESLPSLPCALLTFLTLLPVFTILPSLSLQILTILSFHLTFSHIYFVLHSSTRSKVCSVVPQICSLSRKVF